MDNILQTSADIDNTHFAQALMCKPEDSLAYIVPSNNLTILTQNIRSIYKNLDSFQVTLHSLNFDCDVLVMTECHLSENKPIPVLSDNYNTYYTKKCINQCDGVIFYVSKTLNYAISEPNISNASCLVLTLKDTVVIGIYRSPSIRNTDDFISSLELQLQNYKQYENIIITGDINIDIKLNSADPNCNNYLTTLAYHGLLPGHRLPTRDKMCYDHMMLKTSLPAKSLVLSNAPTDHSTVIINLMYKPLYHNVVKTRASVDFDGASNEIKSKITVILESQDPVQAAECLVDTISTALHNNRKTISNVFHL
ncbi:uncharacterized protein LOC128198177 [Bicyclus anynana]|uniref:Uncharacterized protein LOC128198177 n=1 Tax=Bicyclus anynana TaxID=110368 RepID=A0ABM3LGC5_BICAN|nr:uncharacterized protein LOC128198177 [Bicyclus anynana]